MKVRIGYGLGTQGFAAQADQFAGLVQHLDRLGFDSLWLAERASGPLPDPLIALAVAAGLSRRLKLGTGVLVLPGRNPVLLAKSLSSLDRLSAGRLLLGMGLGVADAVEQQAYGVTREERARVFDTTLPVLRRLWSGAGLDNGVHLGLLPVQSPLEVWLGGRAPSELRRTGRLGDGWLASFCTPAEAAAGKVQVEVAAASAERQIDPEHFGVIVRYARQTLPDSIGRTLASRRPGVDLASIVPVGLPALCTRIEEFVAIGISKFVLVPATEPSSWRDELDGVADAVLPLEARLSSPSE